jgi:hypothetical protein
MTIVRALITVLNWVALFLIVASLSAVGDSFIPAVVIIGCILWFMAEIAILRIIWRKG